MWPPWRATPQPSVEMTALSLKQQQVETPLTLLALDSSPVNPCKPLCRTSLARSCCGTYTGQAVNQGGWCVEDTPCVMWCSEKHLPSSHLRHPVYANVSSSVGVRRPTWQSAVLYYMNSSSESTRFQYLWCVSQNCLKCLRSSMGAAGRAAPYLGPKLVRGNIVIDTG